MVLNQTSFLPPSDPHCAGSGARRDLRISRVQPPISQETLGRGGGRIGGAEDASSMECQQCGHWNKAGITTPAMLSGMGSATLDGELQQTMAAEGGRINFLQRQMCQ